MRYAILGPGGVGGVVGGALARAGHPVTLLVRPGTLSGYPSELTVKSAVFGDFSVPVARASELTEPVDVVWLTTKSTALPGALEAVSPETLGDAAIIPLLNGADHVRLLREHYGSERVITGTIRVGAVRSAPGQIEHWGWHVPPGVPALELAPPSDRAGRIVSELDAAGIPAGVAENDATLLWGKLSMIATSALAGAAAGSMGAAQRDPEIGALMRRAAHQFVAAAATEGAVLSAGPILGAFQNADPTATSSLQRDLEAGLPIELEDIAGPAIRAGRAHGLDVGALERLRELVAARAARVVV